VTDTAKPEPAAPTRDSIVTLRDVTRDTVRAICRLSVTPEQRQFVADNSISISEAHFTPSAWFRAVYADDLPVGFVMLDERNEWNYVYIWRLMIDQRYQRHGYGGRVLALVEERARRRPGVEAVHLSCVDAPGGPRPFYEGRGYRHLGEYEEDELIMVKRLER
jgi:diamine N-acetyltransferase